MLSFLGLGLFRIRFMRESVIASVATPRVAIYIHKAQNTLFTNLIKWIATLVSLARND
ncbi:hypothetical protein [Helicobacter sp. T3_23-1056]